jgi:chorismate mutase
LEIVNGGRGKIAPGETPQQAGDETLIPRNALNIEDWRDEIDRLDEQLVKLLNARSQCAIELGRIKRDLGLAIYSPDREREVIAHVTGINPGPLDRTAVRRLFERIIDESRRIERVTVDKESKGENSGKKKKREKS